MNKLEESEVLPPIIKSPYQGDKKMVLYNKKEFEFKIEDDTYLVTLGITKDQKQIIIRSNQINAVSFLYYTCAYNIEDLQKINNYFKMYNNNNEIYKRLINFLSKNEVFLETDENGLSINIIISIDDPDNTVIRLYLNRQKADNSNIIADLVNKVNNFEKKMEDLIENNNYLSKELEIEKKNGKMKEKEIKKLMEDSKEKDKEIKILYDKLSDIQNEIKILKNTTNKINEKELVKALIDSDIIQEMKQYNNIEHMIQNIINATLGGNICFNLLYRASRDGDSAKEFHNRCDINYEITGGVLVLIKTSGDFTFGGYIEDIRGDNKNDLTNKKKYDRDNAAPNSYQNNSNKINIMNQNTFIPTMFFSLDDLKIFPQNIGYFCHNNLGPSFVCFNKKQIYQKNENNFFEFFIVRDIAFKNGAYSNSTEIINKISKKDFNIKEIEVFGIKVN